MPTPHSMETLAKNRSSARSRSLNPPNWSSHRKIADFSSSRNLSTTDPGTFPACIAASRSLGRVSTGLLTWHPSKKPWTAKQSRAGFYPVSEYWSNFSLSWRTETPFLLPNRFFETAKLGKTLNIYIYIYVCDLCKNKKSIPSVVVLSIIISSSATTASAVAAGGSRRAASITGSS